MGFLKPLTVIAAAIPLALTGCVTGLVTGQQSASKTAMYGLSNAAVCGIVGTLTHGDKGARNFALAYSAVGAGIGGYMDYQKKRLRQSLANTNIGVEHQDNQIKLVIPENVTFVTDSAALNGQIQSTLSAAVQTLVQYPDTTLTINGRTDSTGNDTINKPLSRDRAESVAIFLRSHGVSSTRLSTFGYGSRQPIASNTTVEDRAQDRRVGILINPDQRAVDATEKQT